MTNSYLLIAAQQNAIIPASIFFQMKEKYFCGSYYPFYLPFFKKHFYERNSVCCNICQMWKCHEYACKHVFTQTLISHVLAWPLWKLSVGWELEEEGRRLFGREIASMTFSIKPTGKWAAVVEEVKDNMQKNHQHEHGCSPCGTSSKQRINLLNHLCTWNSARKEKEHLSYCSLFLHRQLKRKKRLYFFSMLLTAPVYSQQNPQTYAKAFAYTQVFHAFLLTSEVSLTDRYQY